MVDVHNALEGQVEGTRLRLVRCLVTDVSLSVELRSHSARTVWNTHALGLVRGLILGQTKVSQT